MKIQKQLRNLLIEAAKLPNQDEIDRVLDKISTQGMSSLTPQEKAVLDNPETTPEVEPYNDPYDEKNEPLDIEDMDQDVEYLKLKTKLNKYWGKALRHSAEEYEWRTANGNKRVVMDEFYKDDKIIMRFTRDNKTLSIDTSEYANLMQDINLKDSEDIESAIKLYMDGVWGILPINHIMFQSFQRT